MNAMDSASSTQGLVLLSVHAGTRPGNPSFARTTSPEHCTPMT